MYKVLRKCTYKSYYKLWEDVTEKWLEYQKIMKIKLVCDNKIK